MKTMTKALTISVFSMLYGSMPHCGDARTFSTSYNRSPQIKCQISMPLWCIAQFYGTIELFDEGANRRWVFQDQMYMKNGPAEIYERKACASVEIQYPIRKFTSTEQNMDHIKYERIIYYLDKRGECILEFRLPARDGIIDVSYDSWMKFQIFIGGKQLYYQVQ